MKTINYLFCAMLMAVLYSCSTPKDIVYFQDAYAVEGMTLQAEQTFRLRPEDKINIVVNSKDPNLEALFTLVVPGQRHTLGATVTPQTTAGKTSNGSTSAIAYTVDKEGRIEFPYLGLLKVAGMTRQDVATMIKQKLIEQNLVNDPIVTVEYVNMGVSVLGEVKNSGRIDIDKDHFTILDAISHAGDLTINGMRNNVMVLRQVNGVQQVYFVDLCSAKSVLQSPAYYLQQDDVVYVSPNKRRQRDSNVNGNSVFTPAFWVSIVSLLATGTALVLNIINK